MRSDGARACAHLECTRWVRVQRCRRRRRHPEMQQQQQQQQSRERCHVEAYAITLNRRAHRDVIDAGRRVQRAAGAPSASVESRVSACVSREAPVQGRGASRTGAGVGRHPDAYVQHRVLGAAPCTGYRTARRCVVHTTRSCSA